jgi:hypothetical protein
MALMRIDGLTKWDTFVIWIKSKLYTVLSVENIDKLTVRKEKELSDLEVVKKLKIKEIREELEEEFSDYYTEEEIDNMLKEIINE